MKKISVVIPAGKKSFIEVSKDKEKNNLEIIVVRGTNPSRNRNIGIKKAKGDFVAFINAHTMLSKKWEEKIHLFFKKYPEIDIVGGPQLNHKSENFFAKSSGFALGSIFGSAVVSPRYKGTQLNLNADETQITSANLICKKKVFKKLRFDENIYPGEDPKLISDAKKSGFKVAYSPEIITYNKRRTGPLPLAKQIYGYGKTRPEKESFAETLRKPFFLVPSLFLIYIILLPLLFLINPLFILPLYLYIVLNLIFSIYESIINESYLSLLILPFLFLIIHISYGIGFLKGLSKLLYLKYEK